jgi:hypothetical protein
MWEDVTVDKMYMVLALFMLIGIEQKPTLRSYYAKNHLLFTLFFPDTSTRANNQIHAVCRQQ